MEIYKNYFSPYIAALGSNIASMLPGKLEYSYFPNSGAEAVEGATKIAYKYHQGQRKYILHADISFHGKLLGAAGLTGSPEVNFKFPTIPNTLKFRFNDIESVKEKIIKLRKVNGESDVYALIVEPLNASTMQSCSEEFLLELRDICTRENIVLIFDEVYTGWGKTGYLFNFMRIRNLSPDILVYAKSFGGGKASISGYSYTEEIAKSYNSLRDATLHSTTYYGFGEEIVTALEAISIIHDENLVENSLKLGDYFTSTYSNEILGLKNVSELRGSGALWGLILQDKVIENLVQVVRLFAKGKIGILDDPRIAKKIVNSAIINELYEKHSILTYFGVNIENPLIISLPLIASENEIDVVSKALIETLNKDMKKLVLNFIKSKLDGPKA
jgi:putrescine aminotransferase